MNITIYTRDSCGPCRMVKTWLKNKGIKYDEINVDDDPSAAKEIMDRTGLMMVPMTIIGEQVISGMNFGLLSKALMV